MLLRLESGWTGMTTGPLFFLPLSGVRLKPYGRLSHGFVSAVLLFGFRAEHSQDALSSTAPTVRHGWSTGNNRGPHVESISREHYPSRIVARTVTRRVVTSPGCASSRLGYGLRVLNIARSAVESARHRRQHNMSVIGMMVKRDHQHVDQSGLVDFWYLQDWEEGSHHLLGLCALLSDLFGAVPPVRARASHGFGEATEAFYSARYPIQTNLESAAGRAGAQGNRGRNASYIVTPSSHSCLPLAAPQVFAKAATNTTWGGAGR